MNNEYDISQAFQRIEETLIKSMSSNLGRHLREEAKEEMNWSAWQAEQLKSLEIYKNYEKKICSDYLKQANVSIAEKDYSSAFQTLLAIDNSSPCSSQINTLIKTIENKINADEKKQWDMQVKVYNDSVSLEKHRVNAIKDIAVSYYKSQQKTNNLIIIK